MDRQESIKRFYVEEHTVRWIAFQVIIVASIALYIRSYWLFLLLAADFALRAFTYFPSPLRFVARLLHRTVRGADKPVFAPPKRFAATMGFAFCIVIAMLFYLQIPVAAFIVGGVLLFCAGLESFCNICVGCYVYDLVIAPFKNRQ
jgi:hypothetical protein